MIAEPKFNLRGTKREDYIRVSISSSLTHTPVDEFPVSLTIWDDTILEKRPTLNIRMTKSRAAKIGRQLLQYAESKEKACNPT